MVVVNTFNQSEVLGNLSLLNCHRVVYPLTIGRRLDRNMWQLAEWNLADWSDQCHRKGGLVVADGLLLAGGPGDCETLAALLLGKIDAMEGTCDFDWYHILNCGFRVPLVGGSGKDRNGILLGRQRTYARVLPGEEFSYKNWIEAIRAGRAFVTNGPLLTLTVEGENPGAVLDLPSGRTTVRVRAEARSALSIERLEIIANGEVVADKEATGWPSSALIETEVDVRNGGWLIARCSGDREEPDALCWRNQAHTNPVYVQVDGRPPPANPSSVPELQKVLDEKQAVVESCCRFETDSQRDRLLGIFQAAREELLRRAGN